MPTNAAGLRRAARNRSAFSGLGLRRAPSHRDRARRRPNPEKSDRFRAEPRRSPAAFVDHRAWPRTFTGAAIIAEDMVREKAMMDVACGRRRRTARESVARPTARAPLKVFPARKAEFRIYGDFLGSQTVGSIDKTTSGLEPGKRIWRRLGVPVRGAHDVRDARSLARDDRGAHLRGVERGGGEKIRAAASARGTKEKKSGSRARSG